MSKFAFGKSNIALIGMPGSGKSTIGKYLAKHYQMNFIDGDHLIEQAAGMTVQQIVNLRGLQRFRDLETQVLSELVVKNTVISTGGSAVFSAQAMQHLGNQSVTLYLKISPQTLIKRVQNVRSRGLIKLPSHHMLRLFAERKDLYSNYADVIFANDAYFNAVKASQLHQLLESK